MMLMDLGRSKANMMITTSLGFFGKVPHLCFHQELSLLMLAGSGNSERRMMKANMMITTSLGFFGKVPHLCFHQELSLLMLAGSGNSERRMMNAASQDLGMMRAKRVEEMASLSERGGKDMLSAVLPHKWLGGSRCARSRGLLAFFSSLDFCVHCCALCARMYIPTLVMLQLLCSTDMSNSVFLKFADVREAVITEVHEGDVLFSTCSYIAETEGAINLVEGERVYVLECHNADWWFVKKHLAEEKGWVPAVLLLDEPNYTVYVQKKLHEKIDKLPVFEKPPPDEKATAPRFIEKLQPKHAPDGTTVQFECQVEGNSRPLITWFKQTAIILPSQDFQMYYDEDNVATLIISELFPEDTGLYTCVAKNNAGFASSSTELIVEAPLSDHGSDATVLSRKSLSRESSLADIIEGIPPTFSRKPKALCVDEGSDVELESRLVAIPEPEITWFSSGEELTTSDNVTVTTESDMHMYTSIVRIKKVRKSQEGQYEVVAKNRAGEATVQITLKVRTGEKEPPEVLEPLRSLITREGDGVVLSTQIVGHPTPEVTWLKNGKPLKQPTVKEGDTYILRLPHTTPADTAEYTVKAKNNMGRAETTASVIVEELKSLEPPLFVKRFQEEKVPEKGTVKLVAKVTGNPVPEITWLRNNEPLVPSSRVIQSYDGDNIILEIRGADSEVDAGDYKCVASNPVGKASHGAKITVDVERVTFTRKLERVVEVDENNLTTLECETSHTVSTKWFHNDKELSGMDHRIVIQEGRTHRVMIKKTTPKDAGTYKCTVKNQSTQTTLTVHEGKPEFIRKLQDSEVKEREVAILEVEVTSETADVTWHKDGEQLNEDGDKVVFEKHGNVRKLLIRGISVHDEGEYTCALEDQECTAEVIVVELPPEIITKLQDVTIAKGESATFEIELTKGDALVRWFKDGKDLQFTNHTQLSIDGKRQTLRISNSELPDVTLVPLHADVMFTVELSRPNVDVKWLKHGKVLKPTDRHIISSDGTVRKLVIKKVTLDDQTDYSCVAGNIKSSTILKVEIIEMAPRINLDSLKKVYKVKKGEDVTVEVKYTATPPPEDEWSVNGTVVKKSKKVTQTLGEDSASLTIKKVEELDIGSYTLRLSNNCGECSAELTLILMEVPSQPGTPEVIEVTDTTVTLHWKAPESDGNSPIINYVLEYHDRQDFTWIKANETFSIIETTHKVTNLEHNKEYMFRVTAVNEVGPSVPSHNTHYIKITTPVSQEPPTIQEPLKGVRDRLEADCHLVVHHWRLRDGKVFKSKHTTYETRVAKYVITETSETSGGTYACQAKNDVGFAETSCLVKIQEPPKFDVDDSLSMQKLRVTNQWKIEVKFRGYPKPEINWLKNGTPLTSTKHCSIFIDESSSTIAIYSLEKEDSGTYTIKAVNEAGSAVYNFSLRVIDKPSKPEGPLIVKDIRNESVTIEWKPPADDGGLEVSKYSVEKCDVEKMVWMKVADVEKDVSSYCVQKLRENSEYMFRVIAENPVGVSEALESETVTIRSHYDKPSSPRGPMNVSGMTATSFSISWQPPESDGGSPVVEYIVERREVGKKAWQKLSESALMQVGSTSAQYLQMEVTGLKTNVSYHMRVTAKNEIGCSPPFAPEDPITAGKRISAPSPPTNLTIIDITSKSVTLQWGPPLSTGGTELTGYIIEKRQSSSQKWTKVATLEPSVTQYCIANLKEKSEWFFQVFAENSIGLSPPACTDLISLKTHATPPSPPTAPLEIRSVGHNSVIIEWGIPVSDGGSPLEGYTIAMRNVKKTMWMEVGRVQAGVQKLTIKDLQENHDYLIRIYARNEVGASEPLESEEPFTVLRMTEMEPVEMDKLDTTAPTLSFSTETTTSWMREANMDADIHSYARGCLLKRDEYFFRIWYYARQLFKITEKIPLFLVNIFSLTKLNVKKNGTIDR
ncbi:hypothetical protein PR048_003503 [Dryococelus australis]|uniref:Titin n=1 Tax=Dryococelus australis TaxID=614101 RepID=A0ABQ9IN82_9NEOP|nr:hypothetical protein PR048_003503 [Dryococelus australis]